MYILIHSSWLDLVVCSFILFLLYAIGKSPVKPIVCGETGKHQRHMETYLWPATTANGKRFDYSDIATLSILSYLCLGGSFSRIPRQLLSDLASGTLSEVHHQTSRGVANDQDKSALLGGSIIRRLEF
ncbi:3-(3-hydroxy-phenyl)propionate/3-hydroxycinnamic acid hydroxylase [Fusarium oxysporum f. sp. albedinis]|nr:3-(3-hydroxy-phenyl)propionate/3-hydroxycinnamic acid hydroxylase [Fusarium oxysporum f. sp. albedinis]